MPCSHLLLLYWQVKSSSATVAGLTDEQLKAGWAPADIEYPLTLL